MDWGAFLYGFAVGGIFVLLAFAKEVGLKRKPRFNDAEPICCDGLVDHLNARTLQ